MKKLLALLLALLTGSALAGFTIGGKAIQLRAFDYSGLAVCSYVYQRFEYIDGYDHGRCIQSAVSFDGMGEAFNPTEAGNYPDGPLPHPSSSRVLSVVANADQAATEVEMAFWQGGASRHVHRKWLTIDRNRNIVEHRIAFEIPANEVHSTAQFEILTGYMPPVFSRFLVWNPLTGGVAPLTDGPGEQSLPIIFCAADETRCMGVYSPQPLVSGGYGRWRFIGDQCTTKQGPTGCVKWNMVARYSNPAGTYRFRVLTTVGNLAEVRSNLAWMRQTFS